jgi:tRNA pseudouridine55 synthase
VINLVQPFWKPASWTSFDVVRKVRNTTRIRKIGHAGTLDPFAEGILVLCFGKATKQVSEIMKQEKEYFAKVKLGITTDTLDPTGKITERKPVPALSEETLEEVCSRFIGTIQQVPPMFSALKVNGTRLYQLARQGKTLPREPREIHIFSIDLQDWNSPDEFDIIVRCDKGTYIRSLAADLAEALGTVGHLIALSRTRVGSFRESDAIQMEQLPFWKPTEA